MSAIILYEVRGLTSAIEFDVVTAEEHSVGVEVTEHPVESGANVSDHVRPQLAMLNIEGVITNTPINETTVGLSPSTIINAQTAYEVTAGGRRLVQPAMVQGGTVSPRRLNGTARPQLPVQVTPASYRDVSSAVGGRSLQTAFKIDRVARVFEVLRELCVTGTTVEVSTGLRPYESMVITSLSAPRTAEDSIAFSIALREIRYVEVRTTTVRRKRPAQKRAQPTKDSGTKPKGWALPAGSDRESLLRQAQDIALGRGPSAGEEP